MYCILQIFLCYDVLIHSHKSIKLEKLEFSNFFRLQTPVNCYQSCQLGFFCDIHIIFFLTQSILLWNRHFRYQKEGNEKYFSLVYSILSLVIIQDTRVLKRISDLCKWSFDEKHFDITYNDPFRLKFCISLAFFWHQNDTQFY